VQCWINIVVGNDARIAGRALAQHGNIRSKDFEQNIFVIG